MAPEMLEGKTYGPQVDVWALGIISYILLAGFHPFDPEAILDDDLLERAIKKGKWNFDDPAWRHVSRDARRLIVRMLARDPAQVTNLLLLTN